MLFYGLFRDDPRMVSIAEGSALFVEGDQGELMYVLVRGTARVIVGGFPVEDLEPGNIAGEMALIDREPRSATVIADTYCEFACVDQERFQLLVSETPGFAVDVMRTLARRLRNADRLFLESGPGSATPGQ